MSVEVDKQSMMPYVIFNRPFVYNEYITLSPIRMKHIVDFQTYQQALTLRKDAIFHEKQIIKMGYLDLIKFACRNFELAKNYELPLLPFYYDFIIGILKLACGENSEIVYNNANLDIYINGFLLTDDVFNDLRRILIIQNDIDFDIDEFMNIDTVKALEKARDFEAKKNKEKSELEDYIDSLIIALKVTEDYVLNMTIRKFWRYIHRINKHENYQACLNGQMGGMVTFKEPLTHWMTTLEVEDKYENLKTDEQELRSKVEG